MARKEQISKQMILDGAFDLVRTQGIEMLTARKLAAHISCSTQPIFRVYTNMEELSNEVFVKAKAFYEQFCLDFEQTDETPFVDLGLCYISFAKKELNLFGSRNAYTRDFEHLIDLVSTDSTVRPERMISAVYDYTDAPKAFDALTHNDGSLAKVQLHFSDPV